MGGLFTREIGLEGTIHLTNLLFIFFFVCIIIEEPFCGNVNKFIIIINIIIIIIINNIAAY